MNSPPPPSNPVSTPYKTVFGDREVVPKTLREQSLRSLAPPPSLEPLTPSQPRTILGDREVVPEVVEPELLVGRVGHVSRVGLLPLGLRHAGLDKPHAKAQEAVDLSMIIVVASNGGVANTSGVTGYG